MKSSLIALAIALALGFATMHYMGLRAELEHAEHVAEYCNYELNGLTGVDLET